MSLEVMVPAVNLLLLLCQEGTFLNCLLNTYVYRHGLAPVLSLASFCGGRQLMQRLIPGQKHWVSSGLNKTSTSQPPPPTRTPKVREHCWRGARKSVRRWRMRRSTVKCCLQNMVITLTNSHAAMTYKSTRSVNILPGNIDSTHLSYIKTKRRVHESGKGSVEGVQEVWGEAENRYD